ncbi:MAG: hypothetical protein ACRBCS_13505 [Cellvibrionaceae bacterium]
MEILLSATLVVSWLAIGAAIYYSLLARKKIEEGQQTCKKLTRDLQVAGNGAAGMGLRIVALEKKLSLMQSIEDMEVNTASDKIVAKHQDAQSANQTSSPVGQSDFLTRNAIQPVSVFEQAKQLLKSGISERQVVKTCGLSTDEVALMKMLIQSGIESKSSKNLNAAIRTSQSGSTHVFA